MPSPLIHLIEVASLAARLVGDVCTGIWEFAALQATETVRDGRRRVSLEKQGHQGLATQDI